MKALILGGFALSAASTVFGAECGAYLPAQSRQVISGNGYVVAFAASRWPISVGQHFSLDFEVCPAPDTSTPARVRVDADMPVHQHGMNYRTKVQSLDAGRYAAQGLMFHMPGRWRLMFDLETGSSTSRLSSEFDIQ
jgi:hypothetical protein